MLKQYREKRGKSLYEEHSGSQKGKDKAAAAQHGAGAPGGRWNRERDIEMRRSLNSRDAAKMVEQAGNLNTRFSAPQIARTFL
jgi:hypothetical protein